MAYDPVAWQLTQQSILNAVANTSAATPYLNVGLVSDSITVSAEIVVPSYISATIDNGSISAKSPDAGVFRVSTIAGDAGLIRVSSIGNDAGNDRTSALQGDANLLHVSSLVGDAGTFRVSARIFGDTTGSLTSNSLLNLSSSQTVKSTAGAIHGWYLWNTDTKPVYFKFYNTSGAINVGTDVPVLRVMVPASASQWADWSEGIKGFTNGIGLVALSAQPDNGTSPGAASATGANIFYV